MALQLTGRARVRVLLIVVVTLAALTVLLYDRVRRSGWERTPVNVNQGATAPVSESPSPSSKASPGPSVQPVTPSPTQSPDVPESEPGLSPETNPNKETTLSTNFVGTLKLIIPVAGVRPDQLLDTFTDARSEGRAHDAIDIPAPAGTPVLAAANGEIIKLFQSERGGTTIYQLSPDKKLVFYYAHLQRYADSIFPGEFVRQGEVIGYVGDTGNAGAGNYHLHFSIAVIADPKRYWEGTNINPFPLLRQ